jgi:hypothetical protein
MVLRARCGAQWRGQGWDGAAVERVEHCALVVGGELDQFGREENQHGWGNIYSVQTYQQRF